MLFLAMVSWWYTDGWMGLGRRLLRRLSNTFDFFSIGLLLKSLFAPFRQISVGRVQGSVNVQLRAWADRQISRAIGAMVRLAVILFGTVAILALVTISVIIMLAWPLVPLVPIIVTTLTLGGARR
jgi:hypothetical protein